MAKTYPTRQEQMDAAPNTPIETDEAHVATYVSGTLLYTLPHTASSLEKVVATLLKLSDVKVVTVPGTLTFFLPGAISDDVTLFKSGTTTSPAYTTRTITTTIENDVPGREVVYTWDDATAAGVPVTGDELVVEHLVRDAVPLAKLTDDKTAVSLADSDVTKIQPGDLAVLYRTARRMLIN